MESVYVVDVVIVGTCQVPVTATTVEEAREKAAMCVTPFHVVEDGWEYVPAEAISDEQVHLISHIN